MDSRWARVARGGAAAIVAILAAAVSHTLAGGAAPTPFGLGASLVIAGALCTVLAGRSPSLARLTVSVGLSQALFHLVFSNFGSLAVATHHSESMATMSAMPSHADPSMWVGHALAALVTVLIFGYAESAFWALADGARLALTRLFAVVVPVTPAVPRLSVVIGRVFAPRELVLLFASLQRRGPPVGPPLEIRRNSRSLGHSPCRARGINALPLPVAPRPDTSKDIMKTTSILFTATALSAGLLLAASVPLSASAHVELAENQAAAGSWTLLEFHVPTESATAVTNEIVITIPQDTPFAYVSYVPVPGWSTTMTTEELDTPITTDEGEVTEAVTSVTWTADPGSEITEGQLLVLPLSVGPVPDTGSIVLAADQAYSDGTVVSWSEVEDEAEFPAPVLYVNDEPMEHSENDAEVTASTMDSDSSDASSGDSDLLARALGVGGLIVGAVGIALAVMARRRTAA